MKTRFTTVDIRASISNLSKRFLGMRVVNVYDIDHKTYLIKLAKPDSKAVILLESGNRIHSTEFDWPKNMTPSSFSMKMRKHLRARRLEHVKQLGMDRIVDLQFGSGEAAYHIILELYDRGNIVLTDFEYSILNILRPRTDESQDVRFAVRETYPITSVRQDESAPDQEKLLAILSESKTGDNIKKTLTPHLNYGPTVIEHALITAGLPPNACFGKEFHLHENMPELLVAIQEAERLMEESNKGDCKGYIIQKREKKASMKSGEEAGELLTYVEFQPFLFKQHEKLPYIEMESFNKAVDEFSSQVESQRLDVRLLQQEKSALKKLDNVKKDHEKRLNQLQHEQATDTEKGQLIEMNQGLVDRAINVVQSALANQIDWSEIESLVKEAKSQGDPVASAIKALRLETNHMNMLLRDPYADSDEEDGEGGTARPLRIDIDLGLSAYGNSRKYFDMKRNASKKEQKTMDASHKALKSAEKKTKQTLKDVQTVATINKARKTHWFEKFLWFITSENYLVIGGRDRQQNELIVRRYLNPGDLYVHADLHGASSVVIKNPTGEEVPPKSLNEAGTMAICNSAAWDARVITSAWYVKHDQVSKTAQPGEYLTTGSFMVRGKKNYLPPSYLVYGFSFLFKLDETCVMQHKGERKVKTKEEDVESVTESESTQDETEDLAAGSGGDSEDEGADEAADEGADEDEHEGDDTDDESAADSDTDIKTEIEEETEMNALKNKQEKQESLKEEEVLFPDTSIQLQHIKGDKFTLQTSVPSTTSADQEAEIADDAASVTSDKSARGIKLSAKQRRDMKKAAKQGREVTWSEPVSQPVVEIVKAAPEPAPEKEDKPASQPQAAPLKRGQKAKLKKIKEKYKDQDDEERELRMQILASAGGPRELKKKGKKAKQQAKLEKAAAKVAKGQNQKHAMKGKVFGQMTVDDIREVVPTVDDTAPSGAATTEEAAKKTATGKADKAEDGYDSEEEKQAVLEEENIQLPVDADIIDALTGQPTADDILMFAIPVAAPYSSLQNYKYKVKLTPGTTKRGKAGKTALNMFMHDRTATSREKDLFKSVKDADISRYIPGKVKVSAPNLQKIKRK